MAKRRNRIDEDIGLQKFLAVVSLIKYLIRSVLIAFCLWMCYKSIVVIGGKPVDWVQALAVFVDKLHLDHLAAILFGVGGVGYGFYERSRRKRSYERQAELRAEREAGEPLSAPSGLNPRGENPEHDSM